MLSIYVQILTAFWKCVTGIMDNPVYLGLLTGELLEIIREYFGYNYWPSFAPQVQAAFADHEVKPLSKMIELWPVGKLYNTTKHEVL